MNDQINSSKRATSRPRSRRTAAWKSGLVAAGIGAVVLGAGYFAGLSVPEMAQASPNEQAAQPPVNETTTSGNPQQFFFRSDDGQVQQFARGRRFDFDDEDGSSAFQRQFGRQPSFRGPVARSRGS